MSNFLKFPKNFWWGGATAAEQIEGKGNTNKGLTVWDEYFRVKPEDFHNRIGPSITSNFFEKYNSDLELYKSININSLRIGISWARVLPNGNDVSKKGLDFYHNVIDKANLLGIKIVLNIFHFDMPLWAQKLGGWESKKVIDKFVKYCDIVYKEFGNKVSKIATMNEPIVPIFAGYLTKTHWPLLVDSKRAVQAGFGTILAHAKAVNLFNEKYRNNVKSQIGVVINVNPSIAKDGINPSKDDIKAAKDCDALHNNAMLIPMVLGKFDKNVIKIIEEENLMPKFSKEDLNEISKIKIDFLGANFYSPIRLQSPKKLNSKNIFEKRFSIYKYDKARYNVFRGWEIRPESLYDLSMYIKNNLNNIPFYIAENGMGVENENRFRNQKSKEIQDNYRIAFLQEHLEQLHKAIKDGANCFGYHMWSIIDNWSWRNAYKNRYGFIEVNLLDQSRKLKKSARWFKKMIEKNGFEDSYKKIEETIDLKNIDFTESV